MAARLAEAEELERELPDDRLARAAHAADRDPRPRRGAARGRRRRRGAAGGVARRDRAPRPTRLERLVGDVLDLAKLDAHRFTVLHEEVEMERLVDQRVRGVRRGGAPTRDRLPAEVDAKPVIVSDGDRVLQIISNLALERLPLDARRRPRSSSSSRATNGRSRRGRRQRAGDPRRSSGSGSSARSGRAAAAAPGSASRSRASWPQALGGRIRPREPSPARAAASSSCCPRFPS